MDDTTKKILEIVTDIQTDVSGLRSEFTTFRSETEENFRSLRAEISDIHRDLENLQNRIGDISGYAKEIDLLLSRVSNIEKLLGIKV